MNSTITLDQMLSLPKEIINLSKEYGDQAEVLSLRYCSLYYNRNIKKDVKKMFDRYKDVKYLYNFSIEDAIRITPVYELREGKTQRSHISQQEKIVTKNFDSLIWATKFHNSILTVAKKLTSQESTYLSDSFFKNISENDIADKFGVCSDTMRHIKHSCLIKVWAEIEALKNDE